MDLKFTTMENDTSCCYAVQDKVQDKVCVHGPGWEPWEVCTVKADAPDTTSIRPPELLDTDSCVCGTPASAQVRRSHPAADLDGNRTSRRPLLSRDRR